MAPWPSNLSVVDGAAADVHAGGLHPEGRAALLLAAGLLLGGLEHVGNIKSIGTQNGKRSTVWLI